MLENKIDKLTKAIEALTAAIEAQQNQAEQPKNDVSLTGNQAEQPKNDVSLTGNGETPPSETPITHEEVKDLCLKISRADRSKKPAIKALIAEYGATVVTQVAAESLAELKAKLEELQ